MKSTKSTHVKKDNYPNLSEEKQPENLRLTNHETFMERWQICKNYSI